MDVLISTASDESELLSLRDWLQLESPRPGRVDVVTPSYPPGAMGTIAEALQVALGAGGAGTVLAASVSMWLRTRQASVRLRLRRPDGSELEVHAQTKNAEAVIRDFLAVADP